MECGINLLGLTKHQDWHPTKLIANTKDGESPFYMTWDSGHISYLGYLNNVFLRNGFATPTS